MNRLGYCLTDQCVHCGKVGYELGAILSHSVSQPVTPIEKEALIAILEKVKLSPDYQAYYTKEVS